MKKVCSFREKKPEAKAFVSQKSAGTEALASVPALFSASGMSARSVVPAGGALSVGKAFSPAPFRCFFPGEGGVLAP